MSIPLYFILQINYPTLVPGVDYILNNPGTGDQIQQWNNATVAQPTSGQLTAWQTDAATTAAWTKIQNGWTNAPILAQLAAIDAQSIRALRETGSASTTKLNTLTTQAAALRAQLLPT